MPVHETPPALAHRIGRALGALWHDLRYVLGFALPIKLEIRFYQYIRGERFSIADLWARSVRRFPGKAALVFHGRTWTFAELDELVRRAAAALEQDGLAPGAHAAIFGENTPAFWWHAIAVIQMGCVPVILRPSLGEAELLEYLAGYDRLPLLLHSDALAAPPSSVCPRFERISCYADDGADLAAVAPTEERALAARRRGVSLFSEAFHIGTSNTTGVSKACIEHQGNALGFIRAHQYMKGLTSSDRVYTTATVSHGEGFAVGGLVPWAVGASVYLDDAFRPDHFFDECRRNDVTVVNYVGVTPRRLLSTPPSPADRSHRVRVANGHEMLGGWTEFQERFGIRRVVEYFAATEGTYFFRNDRLPGAVGFVGPLGQAIYPFAILRLDDDNELVLEGGRPVRCERGEVGELFGAIVPSDPLSLSTYADARLNAGSKVRSLIREGDLWHRSGDLIRHDPSGYVYFAGKRSSSFRVRGVYVNPQVVEDKVAHAAFQGALPARDCLAFFVRRVSSGERVVALRLALSGFFEPAAIFEVLEAVLDPVEAPEFVVLDNAPIAYTDTLRRRRLAPIVDEHDLRVGDVRVLERAARVCAGVQ